MNDLDKRLITAVCSGDICSARQVAKIILENDNTQKNRAFCQTQLRKLRNPSINLVQLPTNINGLLIIEDVSSTFNESRYYLSEREKEVSEKILHMRDVAGKMEDMDVHFLNSSLLYGESGTGKTTFGKYLAYKMGLPFAYFNFSRLIDSHLGSTGNNISKVFDFIKQTECVCMCDELDAIGTKRGSYNDTGEISRIIISLMQSIDTLPNNVVLLGATNIVDSLDAALVRRFTIRHEVLRGNKPERLKMAKLFFDDVGYPYSEEWIHDFVAEDRSQAELLNAMVFILADWISKEAPHD